MKKFTVLSVCFAFVFCVSFISSATASDEEDIMQVAENWFKAFNSNDYELMDSLWWHSPKLTTFGPGGTFLNQGWGEEGGIAMKKRTLGIVVLGLFIILSNIPFEEDSYYPYANFEVYPLVEVDLTE